MYSRVIREHNDMSEDRLVQAILIYLRIIHNLRSPREKTIKMLCELTYLKEYMEDFFPTRSDQMSALIEHDLVTFYPIFFRLA